MATQFKNNIFLKLVAVGFLMLVFMIPTGMIKNLINERQWRSEEAVGEVSSKWGGRQTLVGPILSIPYRKYIEAEDEKITELIKHAYFLPDFLNIEGDIKSENLNRGIYDVVVYKSNLVFSGEFSQPDFQDLGLDSEDILWEDAVISVGIPDVRGINEDIKMLWDDVSVKAKPGFGTALYLGTDYNDYTDIRKPSIVESPVLGSVASESGIHSNVSLGSDQFKKYSFNFNIDLNGSQNLSFVPLGKENNVKLHSAWPTPSFDGAFLPDNRMIDENGFSAEWKVLEYNRSLPQSWLSDNIQNFSASKFGVSLLLGVNQYQKNTRSIKYAIMLIALTFLIFFFVEAMNKIRVHPIQYILVGIAIVLFFSLLLSISEHLNFNLSYLLSALATLSMVTLYSGHIFKNRRLSLLQGGILVLIYLFIFTIIQLEDYALLVGSVGLFLILSIVMFVSRKINWYDER